MVVKNLGPKSHAWAPLRQPGKIKEDYLGKVKKQANENYRR